MARRRKGKLVLGKYYTLDPRGCAGLSRDYLLELAECCNKTCRNCPWKDDDAKPRAASYNHVPHLPERNR